MNRVHTTALIGIVTVAAAVAIAGSNNAAADEEQAPATAPDATAIERTRKTVQMLDDIYKQTIVLITDRYVHDVDDFPAGSAAVLLFKNISESGSHQVRLIDATGDPYEPENVANDDFEREGIKRLKAGAKLHEQVEQVDGKAHLRTLTPVPVVMQKCVMCHDHYADAKAGEPIGAISYSIAIE